jgi:CDP-paratose 2-epimerase
MRKAACAGKIFNIGGGIGNSLSLLELFELLQRQTNQAEPLVFERLPRRQSDQDFFVADIGMAKRLLGWSPLISAEEGVSRMLEWSDSTARA